MSGTDASATDVTDFLLELSGLLVASGDAISDVEDRVRRIATAWGYPDLQLIVLPRSVGIALYPGAIARLSNARPRRLGFRLDQVASIFNVARDAERLEVSPSEGLLRLERVTSTPHRYTTLAPIIGQIIITVGIALMLAPTTTSLGLQAGLGAVVALLCALARRLPGFDTLLPFVAGAAVASIGFVLGGAADRTVGTLIAPLVVLLPGAMLTMATIDLAAGAVVTGTSLLAAAFMQLALLAFGIFVGAGLVGVTPTTHLAYPTRSAWWAAWLGLLVFAVGTALMRSVPLGETPWLLLVVCIVFAAQRLGATVLDPTLSGFVGGAVAAPLALLIERLRSGPPAFVTFLPAFWMLVPGSLGLLGVSQLGREQSPAGIIAVAATMIAVLAIAVGVLVGFSALRTVTALTRDNRR